MSVCEDSRPFVNLQQDASDFRAVFDEDISNIANLLDLKISNLITDADVIGSPGKDSRRLSAHMEFSKAKYDIFQELTATIASMEQNWVEKLEEMRSSFLQNVEIFLANTKLDNQKPATPQRGPTAQSLSSAQTTTSKLTTSPSSLYPRIPALRDIPGVGAVGGLIESFRANIKEYRDTAAGLQNNTLPSTKCPVVSRDHFVHELDDSEEDSSVEEVPKVPMRKAARFSKKPVETPGELIIPGKRTRALRGQAVEVNESMDMDQAQTAKFQEDEGVTPSRQVHRISRSSKSTSLSRATPRKSILSLPEDKDDNENASGLKTIDDLVRPYEHYFEEVKRFAISQEHLSERQQQITSQGTPKTPKNVHFSLGMDPAEDLEVYSPDVSFARSTPRRKTVTIEPILFSENEPEATPGGTRAKSKRKTIGGVAETAAVAPSPKKRRGRASLAASVSESEESSNNLNVSFEGNYSPWLPLTGVDGSIPTQPGVYEFKASQAKRPAYIGSCNSLRRQLTLHKMKEKCGHKHLEKFIERNINHLQVRYEVTDSETTAKEEVKTRVNNFKLQFNAVPAFN